MNVNVRRDLFDNPLGTDGFEFVEFTAPDPERLKGQFEQMGFVAVSRHRSKNVLRFAQGDINFILNMEPTGQPAEFRADHGPSANAMAFRVRDAGLALKLAVERGATAVSGRVRASVRASGESASVHRSQTTVPSARMRVVSFI